jgi:anti-sigma factor RsiW
LKHAFVDGELDLVRNMEIEEHLKTCGGCAGACQNIQTLRAAIKSNNLHYEAPPALRRRIQSAIGDAGPRRSASLFDLWQRLKLLVPVAGIAVLALLLVPGILSRSADARLAQDVTSSHVRSLMASHLTDVASSDQHTVKPWFDGKIDFAPPVIQLADHGFPLVGGRLDYLENRTVAALVYQRQKHLINLFIWPSTHDAAAKVINQNGYHLIHWSGAGMTCWAVSDLNINELTDFTRLIQAETAPAPAR